MLKVQLFGHFLITLDGVELSGLNTARLHEFLAYLILNQAVPVSRQQLAGIFWPESEESQARTNLRNLIHKIRQSSEVFDQYIDLQSVDIHWRAQLPLDLDVAEFEHCLKVKPGWGPRRESLERAVQLYRGDLLPECYAEWIQAERERLREAFLKALESLAVLAEDGRDYRAALGYAARLVQADPLQASANLQLMRLYSLLGDRHAALKAYHEYSQRLKLELDTAPEHEAVELYERVRHQQDNAPEPAARQMPRMVGRLNEWRRLEAYWQTAASGRAQMVFISGEAGIGKTRLVEEMSDWAARQGISTATAFCYPAEGSLPYAPVAAWLRARPLPRLEFIWLAEISRLLPEIARKVPGLMHARPLKEGWQRQHLFEALARAVLSEQMARILILEDIHWCDQDTLEWLHYLLRYNPISPLLILATVRSGELASSQSLATLQSVLKAEGRFNELDLRPLDETETADLARLAAAETGGLDLDPRLASQISAKAEGNPLFVIEMLRLGFNLQEEGLSESSWLEGSERVKAIFTRRLGRLSPVAADATCLAAVIGREFNLDVLITASHEAEEKIVLAIDEMLQKHIIRETSANSYDFIHDLLRQAASAGLSSAHRRLLHRKIAEAYLQLDQESAHPREAEIASHYDQAGMQLLAIQYYSKAAETAAGSFATIDALRYQQRAVDLARDVRQGRPDEFPAKEMGDSLELLGDLLALNGHFPQAQAVFEEALTIIDDHEGLRRARVHQKICETLVPQYRHPEAHAALDRAEEAINRAHAVGNQAARQAWIQVQLTRCQLFYWENETGRLDALLQSITPIVEAEGTTEQYLDLLRGQVEARLRHERYRVSEETLNLVRHRLELAQTSADPFEQALAHFQYGFCLLWHGDFEASDEWLSKGRDGMARIGSRLWELRAITYLGVVSRKKGDLALVREQTRQAVELARALGEYTYEGIAQANQGWLAWKEGDPLKAELTCRQAIETWEKAGSNVFRNLADWVLLELAVEQNDARQAVEIARVFTDPPPNSRLVEADLTELLQQGAAACQGDDPAGGLRLFRQALEAAKQAKEL